MISAFRAAAAYLGLVANLSVPYRLALQIFGIRRDVSPQATSQLSEEPVGGASAQPLLRWGCRLGQGFFQPKEETAPSGG